MSEKPEYIVKVDRDWRYGKRARFWSIQKWYDNNGKGYWATASHGLAYSNWGMWRAINTRLKKMKLGHPTDHFTLDRQPFEEPK